VCSGVLKEGIVSWSVFFVSSSVFFASFVSFAPPVRSLSPPAAWPMCCALHHYLEGWQRARGRTPSASVVIQRTKNATAARTYLYCMHTFRSIIIIINMICIFPPAFARWTELRYRQFPRNLPKYGVAYCTTRHTLMLSCC
jgi:hypothetical protein